MTIVVAAAKTPSGALPLLFFEVLLMNDVMIAGVIQTYKVLTNLANYSTFMAA